MHDFGPTYVLSFEIKMMVICWFFVVCVRHQKVLIRLDQDVYHDLFVCS